MIVSEEQITERLNSRANVIHKSFARAQRAGAKQPEFLKEITAGLCLDGEEQKHIAREFEITQPSVSYAFSGKSLNDDGRSRLANRKQEIQDAALDRLADTLGLLDEDKMRNCKAIELSQIASNMSKVVEKMEGRNGNTNNVLIVYSPKMKTEEEYETIAI